MAKQRILITGITGFVGSHMADYLIGRPDVELFGTKRWNMSRLRNIKHLLDDPRLTLIDCDITDAVGVKNLIETVKPDRIFHFAAESFVSPSWLHPHRYMDLNYHGTVNIMEACRNAGLNPRMLIAGSPEEHGDIKPEELPITESTVLRPVNPYAVTKVAQDLIGYVYHRSYGMNIIRTRAFNHEGPRRDHVFGLPWYAYQIARIEAGKQKPLLETGHTGDKRNFTHIKDMIEAYYLAIEKCTPGELYLIGSDEEDHICTFTEALEAMLKLSTAKNIEIKVNPKYVRPTALPFLIGKTTKFRELTGWKPKIGINQILKDTLDYWREFVQNDYY